MESPPSVPLGAFLVICASVTALMWITHPFARHRLVTNHLRRTHLTDNWAVACNYKSSITNLLQLRNRRGPKDPGGMEFFGRLQNLKPLRQSPCAQME
jgi:hypothetical protein